MKTYSRFFRLCCLAMLILTGTSLFTACTERIDIETNSFSRSTLVVYGEITNEWKLQAIQLSRSAPFFDKERELALPNAKVIIQSSDNEEYELKESNPGSGNYFSTQAWSAKVGIEYRLIIDIDFNNDGQMKRYEASTTILPPLQLDSIQLVPQAFFKHTRYLLKAYGQDPPTTDFYLFRFTVNGASVVKKLSRYVITNDIAFNGQYINGLSIYNFKDIAEREDDSEDSRRNSIYLKKGDKLGVEMSMITQDYFDFIKQSQSEIRSSNPMFGGPPANITSNISNGGVGYFAGYCTSIIDTEVE